MTKRPSAQVEADVYFRWKQVRLFLPVQKLPVMLWGCLTLFMSPSVLCGSSWLHPLFKVQLCMRDKVFDSETRSCLLLRLMLLLSLRLSAAHDTISVTGVCYWSHHRIPSHTPKTLNLFLVSVVSYLCLNGRWCCRMAWGEWGLKSDLPLGHLSRKCLFGASILRQKIWFLLFFFLAQPSRQYIMSTVSSTHSAIRGISHSHYMVISRLSQQHVEGTAVAILQANSTATSSTRHPLTPLDIFKDTWWHFHQCLVVTQTRNVSILDCSNQNKCIKPNVMFP